jgi:hypothetical protein
VSGAIFKNEEAVVEALLEGGADPDVGQPTAVETAKVFGKTERWEKAFADARERRENKTEATQVSVSLCSCIRSRK